MSPQYHSDAARMQAAIGAAAPMPLVEVDRDACALADRAVVTK